MQNKLVEGVDYYYNEDGLIVLTEKYHLERGYCCGNGCRHCPYDYERVEELKKAESEERERSEKSGERRGVDEE
jgi:hypothetical protein